MDKIRTADLHPVDADTLMIVHLDDEGNEVSEKFDIGDPMSPLTFKVYIQKNKIEGCNCYMEEESGWQEELMDKFFNNAEELFTMGDQKIESGYLN